MHNGAAGSEKWQQQQQQPPLCKLHGSCTTLAAAILTRPFWTVPDHPAVFTRGQPGHSGGADSTHSIKEKLAGRTLPTAPPACAGPPAAPLLP
jgi:hypothetical protein